MRRSARFFPVFLLLALAAGFDTPLRAAAQTDASQAIEQGATEAMPSVPPLDLDDLEHRTFEYFWQTANPQNGLVPDHWPLGKEPFSSIASVGFALTAYPIGVERGWITRQQARQRVLTTLRFFANAPQGPVEDGMTGYKGFFYHFLDMHQGHRYARWVEVSTIDTTWLITGVLFDQTYFDQNDQQEREIRDLAEKLYRGIDWNWAQARPPRITMGWTPGGKFTPYDWEGYDEAMMLYVLALASPTHPVKSAAWTAWASTYDRTWGSFMGSEPHVGFAPLFGHQYSHAWIDFRGIQDAYMRKRGLDYFENSVRSTLGQRDYAIANPLHFRGYGEDVWGLTACNGPGETLWEHDGTQTQFLGYGARGADTDRVLDDGTLAPTAAISSIVFTPEISLRAMQEMYRRYGPWLYSNYGFKDAFNPSFQLNAPLRSGSVVPGQGWFDNEYLGIDQGPILLMIENYRSGFVWKVMRANPYVRKGLQRAGFKGGWLSGGNQTSSAPRKAARQGALAEVQ